MATGECNGCTHRSDRISAFGGGVGTSLSFAPKQGTLFARGEESPGCLDLGGDVVAVLAFDFAAQVLGD
jgi:hypothetical protein